MTAFLLTLFQVAFAAQALPIAVIVLAVLVQRDNVV
jgi:hypothetical protein